MPSWPSNSWFGKILFVRSLLCFIVYRCFVYNVKHIYSYTYTYCCHWKHDIMRSIRFTIRMYIVGILYLFTGCRISTCAKSFLNQPIWYSLSTIFNYYIIQFPFFTFHYHVVGVTLVAEVSCEELFVCSLLLVYLVGLFISVLCYVKLVSSMWPM